MPSSPSDRPTRVGPRPGHRSVPSAGFVRRLGEDVQPGDLAVRRDASPRRGPGRAARRSRPGQAARPPPPAGLGDLRGRRARRALPHARAGQVADICSHAIIAAAREAGADTTRAARRGDARQIASAVEDLLPSSDLLVVCGAGGGRAGAEARAALDGLGEIDDTRVAMHPGSAQGFGRLGPDAVPVFLFPSHPATALLLFEVFVRPLMRTLEAAATSSHRLRPAHLAGLVRERPSRLSAGAAAAGEGHRRLPCAAARHLRPPPPVRTRRRQLPDRAPEDATDVGLDEPVTVLHLPA